MKGVRSLAYITFLEGIRSRALFGIFILALLMFTATVILTNLFMRDIMKVAADLSLSTISFAGLLMVVFIGTNLLAKDIDKRTIYMVISRPLSRSQYVVGKYFGLCSLVMAAILLLGIVSSLPVYLSVLTYHNPVTVFSWPAYFSAIGFIALKLAVMSSIIIFFSSITSTSFISLVLTIATYLIGSTNEVVKSIMQSKPKGEELSLLMTSIIKFVYYIFPNLSAFDLKLQASHGLPVPGGYLISVTLYGLFYIAIMITAAAIVIERREFP